MGSRILICMVAALMLAACAQEEPEDEGSAPGPSEQGTPQNPQGTNDGTQSAVPGGMPCEVAELIETRCSSCHGNPPQGGPMPMVTREDLLARSTMDPSKTVAERSVIRMRDSAFPMPPPPNPMVPESEIAAMEAWIAAGTPEGACLVEVAANTNNNQNNNQNNTTTDPVFDAPAQCSSNDFEPPLDQGGREGPEMQPGRACISCHLAEEGRPLLAAGGTVYPTAHEPDLCKAPATEGAVVEITDANQRVFTLAVNRVGNFLIEGGEDDIAKPYTARLLHDGKERVMKTPQTSADCNSCHTQEGASGAPGRIVLP